MAATRDAEPEGVQPSDAPLPRPVEPGLRVGIVDGVTLAKWSRVWAERHPDVALHVEALQGDPRAALDTRAVDACFVRLPVRADGLSVIPLYEERAVVVVPTEHPVAAFDEVGAADLVDEDLLQDPDEVPAWRDAARAGRARPLPPVPQGSTAELVALVAAGVGLLVVPQSVARLHHRRDLTYRPLTDVEPTRIALAWPADRTTPLVEELVGIVRGRTARSSRTTSAVAPSDAPAAREAERAPGTKRAGTGARGGRGGAGGARRGLGGSGRSGGAARRGRPGRTR